MYYYHHISQDIRF